MKAKGNIFERQLTNFEENRFGAMTFMMTFQSCYGSIAAMMGLKMDSTFALAITAAITMASNAMFIAQSPAKWCVGTFYVSIVLNSIIILTYLVS